MAMTGGHVALIIFIVIIVLGLIVVIILAATGVFAESEAEADIKGVFSLEHEATKNYFTQGSVITPTNTGTNVVINPSYNLTASDSGSIACANYTWTYTSYSSTTTPTITIPQALIWGGSSNLIVTAASATDGADITLSTPTSANTLSSWVFDKDTFRWCLASTPSLCLFYDTTTKQTTLKTFSTSVVLKGGFVFTPRKPISSPKCS